MLVANVRWLSRYRHQRCLVPEVATVLLGAFAAALNSLHAHINAMIDDDPAVGTAAIWQRLADDHGATVAYYTLRTYVVSRCPRMAAGNEQAGEEHP